jgi:NhaP-type Na+/H+ or K+/H+ antiporter
VSTDVLIAVVALLLGWSLLSGRLERLDVTGPIVFVLAGLLLCNGPWAEIDVTIESPAVHGLAEITLALLLFADAARINPKDLRHNAGLPIRLLAIGLPLTFAIGFGLGALLLTDLPWELAALLGAVLAPTDAALSASVVSDESLPQSIRRSLNVESGLNDGIATPVVTALIAASAAFLGVGAIEDTASAPGAGAVVDLLGGAAIGAIVGYLGGIVVSRARAVGWIAPGGRRIATLMLALLAFLVAEEAAVNYFVAAFLAGFAFRAGTRQDDEEATELPELIGRILALAVWFVFGAGLVLDGLELVDWRIALYAVLSLSVIRMTPVAISMIGAGFDRPTTLFIGWFGPRGLASVVFGLLIVEELPANDPRIQTVLSTIVLTVLLSVVLHGISGRPLTAWLRRQALTTEVIAPNAVIRPPSPFGVRHAEGEFSTPVMEPSGSTTGAPTVANVIIQSVRRRLPNWSTSRDILADNKEVAT